MLLFQPFGPRSAVWSFGDANQGRGQELCNCVPTLVLARFFVVVGLENLLQMRDACLGNVVRVSWLPDVVVLSCCWLQSTGQNAVEKMDFETCPFSAFGAFCMGVVCGELRKRVGFFVQGRHDR